MAGEWEDLGAEVDTAPDKDTPTVASAVPPLNIVLPESAELGMLNDWASITGYAKLGADTWGKIARALGDETLDDVVQIASLSNQDLVDVAKSEGLLGIHKVRLNIAVNTARLKAGVAPSDVFASPPPSVPTAAPSEPSASNVATKPEGHKLGSTMDAGAAMATQCQALKECMVICIDRSGSMGAPFLEVTVNVVKGAMAQRTRMEAVKAMFYAFRDRVEGVGLGTHQLGLIQFDNEVERLLDLTLQLQRFEAIVDDVEKRGQTAIYSAIVEATAMLEGQFSEDSQTDLRILVLTDGQSNTGVSPTNALAAANRIGAVVDAIIVGDRPDANLRKIVNATGGECYQINDLGEGFELLEAEGVVSLHARRGGVDKPPFKLREMIDFGTASESTMTRGAAVKRAPVLAQKFAMKAVVDVASMKDDAAVVGPSTASTKRLLMELKQVASGAAGIWLHSGDGVHIFPAPESLNFWRALIEGPEGSPFEGGVFALNVVIPDSYPLKAPDITFETPIYHCNVSDSGKICLGLLQDHWSPTLSIPKCLEAIRMMLKSPDTDNSLRQWIAELTLAHQSSHGADTRYYDKARECTRQEASLTVADWKQKWKC